MRIGVIGCGRIAEKHIMTYKKMPDVRVVTFDKDIEAAKKLSEKLKVDYFENVGELIGSDEFDAIDICVPVNYHKEYVLKALRSRKHIFCEKPLCLDLKEALEIKEQAVRAEKMVMVGYLYRFHPALQFVKKVLNEGVIGKPHFAIFRLGGRGSHRPWKHRISDGGGAVMEMMVHELDLIVWYFENLSRSRLLMEDTIIKSRQIGGKKYEADAEDIVMLELESDGARILCESDLISPSYMNYIEIHGENGSLFTSILHFMPTIVFCKESRGVFNTGNNIYNFPMENLFEIELRHFIDCVKSNQTTINSIEESLKVFEILEQAGLC